MKGLIMAALGLTFLPFVALLMCFFGMLILVALAAGGSSGGSSNMSMSSYNVPASGKGSVPLSEVVQLAHNAGLPDGELATAVAIAEAESGRNPNAVDNDSNGSVDRGLWQINSTWGQTLPGNEFSPSYNATSMAYISQGGTNWSPWVTYQTGAYQQYLPEAEQAVAEAGY